MILHKDQTLNIFQAGIVITLKTSIKLISSFSHTALYFLYILFGIIGFFCKQENSIISFFCKSFVFLLIFLSLFLSLLLNSSATKKRIEKLIGISFLERYLPGKAKGIFPLFLFLLTLNALDYIESFTILTRVTNYKESVDLIHQQLDQITADKTSNQVLRHSHNALLLIRALPYGTYPTTGIITDIASYFPVF